MNKSQGEKDIYMKAEETSYVFYILGVISIMAESLGATLGLFIPIYGEYGPFCSLDALIRLLIALMAIYARTLSNYISNYWGRKTLRVGLLIGYVGNLCMYLYSGVLLSQVFTHHKILALHMQTEYQIGTYYALTKFTIFTYLVFTAANSLS